MSKQDTLQEEETPLLKGLVEQQGVAPVDDLDDLYRLWPGDEDPDQLLSYLQGERAARRRLASSEDNR